jgi:hypothetical protein
LKEKKLEMKKKMKIGPHLDAQFTRKFVPEIKMMTFKREQIFGRGRDTSYEDHP